VAVLPALARIATLLAVAFLLAPAEAYPSGTSRFSSAEPVWSVNDTLEIPEPVYQGWNLNRWLLDEHWLWPMDDLLALRSRRSACDVNCLEEVPASSWFTPRNGARPMSPHDVGRGNARLTSLAPGPLSVTEARLDGRDPYIIAEDVRGSRCILEFDDPSLPEMRTAAAVISNRILHAAGYHVLECFIAQISTADLTPSPEARKIGEHGGSGDLSEEHLERFFAGFRIAEENEEVKDDSPLTLRVVASRLPEGVPKGVFRDRGRRTDDPNDLIPHEDRRSLRGLRILASWIDHSRFRPDRTMDVYLQPQGYLRHYLTGFSATLGAVLRAADSSSPKGTSTDSDLTMWRAAEVFRPFEQMDQRDAFWGLSLLLSFTDEQVRAAVDAGRFSNPEWASAVATELMERRDRIGRAWLGRMNGAVRLLIANPGRNRWALTLEDLGVRSGLREPQEIRYIMTFSFPATRERCGSQTRSGENLVFDLTSFTRPGDAGPDDPHGYGIATLRAYDATGRAMGDATRAHIRFDPATGPRIVGIERD
jgi:hypothetical protein